jgi:UDP-N-acetylglucosamine 2-epimerase (non-hydrolysing)
VYKIMTVFGTRPEAIKMAPLVKALAGMSGQFVSKVAVTAQHREMLDQVLAFFGIVPDYDLNIMQARQSLTDITVRTLAGLEEIFAAERPDIVLVHGDTTTTFAASLAAFYRRVAVGHVEAGLRTGNKYLPYPEEMNRCLTGAIAHWHYAPTRQAKANLLREGVAAERIFVTGNTAIDALFQTVRSGFRFENELLNRLDYTERQVIVVDAHRRENHGRPLENICAALLATVQAHPAVEIVFSVHKNPAVADVVRNLLGGAERVHLLDPLDYVEWANLMNRAYIIVTDSGGLQEEAPSLGKPVLLLRETTERPEAIAAGTVRLVGTEREKIVRSLAELLGDRAAYDQMARTTNPYGDGKAAPRIAAAIAYAAGHCRERPAEFSG